MGISKVDLKEHKGKVAVLGVLIVLCGVVLWMNLRGDSAPPAQPVKLDEVAPTPEVKKQYEQQFEQARKVRSSSGG